MKATTPFRISEFSNPSGKIVFQLHAFLDGKRFRKNFKTGAEAEAEGSVQEVDWLRESNTRAAITRLTDAQLREPRQSFGGSKVRSARPRSASISRSRTTANP